jgi:uncharacterized protein YegJ (DUF2314 family)
MRPLLVVLVMLGLATAEAQTISEKAKSDELVYMQDEEPAMQRAFQKAQDSLDEFLALAKSPPAEYTGFALKVAIPAGRDTEYFWVGNFARKDYKFTGVIDNEPRLAMHIKIGQTYEFNRSQVVDWTYIDKPKRKMVGNFTLCALLTKESKAEAEAMKKRFNLDCET